MKLSNEIKLELLRRMILIRAVEETIAARYKEQKMRCPTHLCTGQEAVSAAVGLALDIKDTVVSTHRAHGHYIGKGGDIKKMLAEIYGKKTGCSNGKGGSMHLIDKSVGFMGSTAIVGGTIPIGVGLALSFNLKNTGQISCVFLGDGATEEGVFYESVNFATLKNLPVLFICENNFYSVYSPLKVRQPRGRKIYEMAKAIGIDAEYGDGNNVMEVFNKVSAAIKKIRNGEGPYFFEFSTYRWREHCGPNFDNDLGYRTIDEYSSWKEQDPLLLMESHLIENNILSADDVRKISDEQQQIVDEAFVFAEESPFPKSEEIYTNVYCEKNKGETVE